MNRLTASLLGMVCVGWVSAASAQIFYEPVTYQYGSGSGTFYYGGQDPRVFDLVPANLRSQEYSSVVRSVPVVSRTHVYSDSRPLRDQADNSRTSYGSYTANDARNEAYANVPRYFRKRELLRAAEIAEDGTWVVPAQAQPRVEIRVIRPFDVSVAPAVRKGTILVIPRKFLEKKVKVDERTVVMAQP